MAGYWLELCADVRRCAGTIIKDGLPWYFLLF